MESVHFRDLEIAYRRAGSGAPVVFVHGAAGDGRLWQPQLDDLSDELTVVAWDEPGAGASSDLPADFKLADYADALAFLIESLALGPAHVAGLSWGGTIVLDLYRRRPETVASLILADTYVGWKGSLPAEEVQARVDGVRAMVAAPEFVPLLPGLFAGDPPAAYTELLEGMLRAARREALLNEALVLADTDLRDVLPTIEVPALLIWGELDVRSPLSVAQEFEQSIPNASLVVIPGAGHVTNLEDPERFNAAIRDWCRAQAATASSR